MGVRIAYGKREDIDDAVRTGAIPKETFIVSNEDQSTEMFYLHSDGSMHSIAERQTFYSIDSAESWISKYNCRGRILSVYTDGHWRAYIVTNNDSLSSIEGSGSGGDGGSVDLSDIKEQIIGLERSVGEKSEESDVQSDNLWSAIDEILLRCTRAIDGKVDKVEGCRLITEAEAEKLNKIDPNANVNLIDRITLGGSPAEIKDKTVDIPKATKSALGLVMGKEEENHIVVNNDGSMTVHSLNVIKLTQSDGDLIILDGGSGSDYYW